MNTTTRTKLVLSCLCLWAYLLQVARAHGETKMFWIVSIFTFIFGFLWYETRRQRLEEEEQHKMLSSQHEKKKKPSSAADYDAKSLAQLAAKRVGRNDVCPCGSGLKFKNCCQDVRDYARHKMMHVPGGANMADEAEHIDVGRGMVMRVNNNR
eukprot:PhM_4_TR15095/c0_g1_i1/m.71828